MPPQGDNCEGIRNVPMLLDVLKLRRDESRVPPFTFTKCEEFREEDTREPVNLGQVLECGNGGHAAPNWFRSGMVYQRNPMLERSFQSKIGNIIA